MLNGFMAGDREVADLLGGGPIEVKETHISIVLLGAGKVLKLKKPLDYGFLDYSTLERRKAACEAEVRLNSRMCPRIYLGVVPIRVSEAAPVSDYGVLMKRLPADRMLDALVRRGEASEEMLDLAARKLAEFHLASAWSPDINAYGSFEVIAGNWQENFRQTEAFAGETIDPLSFQRIREWVNQTLAKDRALLESRVTGGHIVDGHGDVRCESICFCEDVCFFDCIEFNDRFRCGDAAAEIAFLAMDLNVLGRPDLAWFATERYRHHSGDAGLWRVLPLYLCYRAYVRGKVLSFRSCQAGISVAEKAEAKRRARAFFDLALRYASGLRAPAVVVMCGRSGTGKTSVARGIAHELGLRLISTDAVRLDLLGPEKRQAEFGEGPYSKEVTERVYAESIRQARELLAAGTEVVVDGTFLEEWQRRRVGEMAQGCGVPLRFVHCELAAAEVRNRLDRRAAMRDGVSDATWEIHLRQKLEPPAQEDRHWLRLNTEAPIGDCARQATDWLRSLGVAARVHS